MREETITKYAAYIGLIRNSKTLSMDEAKQQARNYKVSNAIASYLSKTGSVVIKSGVITWNKHEQRTPTQLAKIVGKMQQDSNNLHMRKKRARDKAKQIPIKFHKPVGKKLNRLQRIICKIFNIPVNI